MPQVTVGLKPNKVSYFCPETRLHLTLAKPYGTAYYETADQLKGIVKSLLSSTPTLVYYNGEIPKEAVDAFVATFAAGNTKGKDRFVRDHATNLERAVPSNNVSVRAEKLLAEVAVKNGREPEVIDPGQPGEGDGGEDVVVQSYVPPAAEVKKEEVKQEEKVEEVVETKTTAKKSSAKKTTDTPKEESAE